MRKVIIIGCPGSGKSTFARALQDPGAPESRAVLDAVPRIFTLSEIPEIVREQRN